MAIRRNGKILRVNGKHSRTEDCCCAPDRVCTTRYVWPCGAMPRTVQLYWEAVFTAAPAFGATAPVPTFTPGLTQGTVELIFQGEGSNCKWEAVVPTSIDWTVTINGDSGAGAVCPQTVNTFQSTFDLYFTLSRDDQIGNAQNLFFLGMATDNRPNDGFSSPCGTQSVAWYFQQSQFGLQADAGPVAPIRFKLAECDGNGRGFKLRDDTTTQGAGMFRRIESQFPQINFCNQTRIPPFSGACQHKVASNLSGWYGKLTYAHVTWQ